MYMIHFFMEKSGLYTLKTGVVGLFLLFILVTISQMYMYGKRAGGGYLKIYAFCFYAKLL